MKTKPFNHQQKSFDFSKDLIGYGIWWEQGTGKSKLLIDTICHLWATKKITGALIVAPNSVHANFVKQEMKTHWWDEIPTNSLIYYSELQHTKKGQQKILHLMSTPAGTCPVLVMSYDGVRTEKGYTLAMEFLHKYVCMMALDESTAIAEPGTKQTKKCHALGPMAKYRRVMSGTPMAEGPFKIYSQMKFLYPDFWKRFGLSSYFVFRQMFAKFEQRHGTGGHQYQHLICYQNLPLLSSYIAPYSTRVLKEDVLDLPPKLYSRVEFEMSPKQSKMYETLKEEFRVALDAEHTLEANTALVRITRLQQITSGFAVTQELPPPSIGDIGCWVTEEGRFMCEITEIINKEFFTLVGRWEGTQTELPSQHIIRQDDSRFTRLIAADPKTIDLFEKDNENPRLKALESILEPITHKVIIWARFKRDIDLICRSLGDAAVRFDGSVGNGDREIALSRFRDDPSIRYFVANPAAISMGVTLTQAKTVIYYSNTFQLEKRLQSEDRAHRIGQDVSVNIIDLVAQGTVDNHIVETLRKKFDLAAIVNGDRFREWIQ